MRDRLVRRWIDIIDGNTTIKTVVWCGTNVPVACLLWAVQHYLFQSTPGLVDVALLDLLLGSWTVAITVVFVVAIIASMRGKDAVECVAKREIEVKGIPDPVRVYEAAAPAPSLTQQSIGSNEWG